MLCDLAAVTPEQINALGLEIPDDLTGVNVPLWRSSQRAKYHWADERSACQHLPGNRHWQHPKNRTPPPVSDHVAALGFAVPEPLAGVVRVADLDQVLLITQRQLRRPGLDEGLDLGARSALIQSNWAGRNSVSMRALVSMP